MIKKITKNWRHYLDNKMRQRKAVNEATTCSSTKWLLKLWTVLAAAADDDNGSGLSTANPSLLLSWIPLTCLRGAWSKDLCGWFRSKLVDLCIGTAKAKGVTIDNVAVETTVTAGCLWETASGSASELRGYGERRMNNQVREILFAYLEMTLVC